MTNQVVKLHHSEAVTAGAEVSGITHCYNQMLLNITLHILKRKPRTFLIQNQLVQHYLLAPQKCVLVAAGVQQTWCQNLTISQVLFI